MRTVRVVGLDVSLASTGVATLACTAEDQWSVHTYPIPTAPVPAGSGAPERVLLGRMDYVVSTIAGACEHADLVAIERPAYSARGNAVFSLGGLWWLAYRRITRLEVPVLIVAVSSAKRYGANNGNASKRDMSRAAVRMWPDVETRTGDEDDALVIASLAADLTGLPVPYERTAYRRDALKAVTRPDDLPEFD